MGHLTSPGSLAGDPGEGDDHHHSSAVFYEAWVHSVDSLQRYRGAGKKSMKGSPGAPLGETLGRSRERKRIINSLNAINCR